ncbi:hypothetical protein SDC9_184012 [bioreactor metagenome]|uniref:Uncharacterized protein n=1 Tax=bioreactor metagenome TaxID=1076179 RepID=A0A645HLJ5_9ZZZZ
MASTAAVWTKDVQQVIEWVCSLCIALISSSGAMTQPILHPVIAYVFDRPDTVNVLSKAPSKDAMGKCFPP